MARSQRCTSPSFSKRRASILPLGLPHAGDIVAVAGIDDITIGDSLVDPNDPRPRDPIHVDNTTISMTIGINTSPLAGKVKGHKLTARQVKDRLDQELIGNVSIRVLPTDRPDQWEVQDRGELALAILVEQMRREGFELTVGKPQVVTREIDGKRQEPMQRTTIDVPEEFLGTVTQLMAARKGRMETMANHGSGWVRMEFVVPARGMIGFRSQFLTQTRGTGIASSIGEGYAPWQGNILRARYGIAGLGPRRAGHGLRAPAPRGSWNILRGAGRRGVRRSSCGGEPPR